MAKKDLIQRLRESIMARRLTRAVAAAPLVGAGIAGGVGGMGSALADELFAKPKYSIESEVELNTETNSNISRFELLKGYNYLLRLENQNTEKGNRRLFGGKVPIDSPFFRGYVDVFGTNDSQDNYSGGINFEGLIRNNILVGGAAEKSEVGGVKSSLLNFYSGLKSQDRSFSIGVADVKRGKDDRTVYHGTFLREFKDLRNFIISVGGLSDNKEDSYAHFVVGQYPEKRGQGFGWRIIGMSELEGDIDLDCVLAMDSTFSKWSYEGASDSYTFFHERKIRAGENVMDYFRPFIQLYRRTNNVAAANIRFNHKNGESSYLIDTIMYPTGVLRKLKGEDKSRNSDKNSFLDSLWVGGGYETAASRFVSKAGIKLLNGKLNIWGVKKEGQKPYVFAGFYTDF